MTNQKYMVDFEKSHEKMLSKEKFIVYVIVLDRTYWVHKLYRVIWNIFKIVSFYRFQMLSQSVVLISCIDMYSVIYFTLEHVLIDSLRYLTIHFFKLFILVCLFYIIFICQPRDLSNFK